MSLSFYNTYTRKKEEFIPVEPGVVRIYNCGPTVYDFAHIGNFRANIFADLLRRWLGVRGYQVHQIMNITDVDDKTIRRSREENISLHEYTQKYSESFFSDLNIMNILRADKYPAATEHVNEMIDLIKILLEKNHAYRAEDGSIYFKVASFPDYGNLSGKRLEDLRIGERVSSDEYETKDDVKDFALWKAWAEADGDVFWDTDLGKGRPGWHIECSAMSMKYLGETFDIHTGGVDNIFPHHENEIAQSLCAVDGEFAKLWMHCEYLLVDNKKMSKSLGNYYTISDLLDKGFRPREIRYVLAATHYRSQLNFTLKGLEAAQKSLARIDEFRDSWQYWKAGESSKETGSIVDSACNAFENAMDDDLNVSKALASVFNLIRQINSLATERELTTDDARILRRTWEKWDEALGFILPFGEDEGEEDIDTAWIEERIAARNAARENKDWNTADIIRDELAATGIIIRDNPQGTTWKKE
ncbi:MAG: cysteine--tRNA ligase [Candidatus Electryonea clarkiae]|nr:cysteine--tRNA ligase [Candidatus Electryonea clarkiae]MDP8288731.1 cysteine--tRNA ligase [Candidatus Electryonea clarkiae]